MALTLVAAKLLILAVLSSVSSPSPAPQFFPSPFSSPGIPSRQWQNNFTNPTFLDPLTGAAAEELMRTQVPRQLYSPQGGYRGGPPPGAFGVPPPVSFGGLPPNFNYGGQIPNLGFPQIYRVDNLIIIANPSPQQPQPCIPQRPPPNFPDPRPKPPSTDGQEDGLNNRFGNEPSKCTWAIVACCSPDNVNVRYNCFELLGCPGFFFDNSPCEPNTVMAAANAALEFYTKSANNNASSSAGSDDNVV